MDLQLSIITIRRGGSFEVPDAFQYWLIIEGKGSFISHGEKIVLSSHDLLEIPDDAAARADADDSEDLVVGIIDVFDYPTKNAGIRHYVSKDTELIRKAFFLALEIKGMQFPGKKEIVSDANQLLFDALLKMSILHFNINPYLDQLLAEISAHYADPGFELQDAINRTGYSQSQIRRLFKQETGVSPVQHVNNLRIQKAKRLLRNIQDEKLLTDVALQCGFTDPYYFSRLFRRFTGLSPSEYMKEVR